MRFTCFMVGLLLLNINTIIGQKVVGLSTKYDDRFDEWVIVTDDPEKEGQLEATWAIMNDFSEWQYSLGDLAGVIRLRNKENPNIWEVVGGGEILEVRTVFPFEFDHWQISGGRVRLDVKMYRNDPEQWLAKKSDQDLFFYTYKERDIRDWVVENNSNFSLPLQLAILFVPILQVVGR